MAGRPARRPNGKSVIAVGAGFAGLAARTNCSSARLRGRGDRGPRPHRRAGVVQGLRARQGRRGGGELIGSNHFTWQAYAQQFGLRMLDVTTEDELAFPIRLNGRMCSTSVRPSASVVRDGRGPFGP
ncbi:MAG: hypothetical protein R3B68_14155 [Phycisphaerales bacterium]